MTVDVAAYLIHGQNQVTTVLGASAAVCWTQNPTWPFPMLPIPGTVQPIQEHSRAFRSLACRRPLIFTIGFAPFTSQLAHAMNQVRATSTNSCHQQKGPVSNRRSSQANARQVRKLMPTTTI